MHHAEVPCQEEASPVAVFLAEEPFLAAVSFPRALHPAVAVFLEVDGLTASVAGAAWAVALRRPVLVALVLEASLVKALAVALLALAQEVWLKEPALKPLGVALLLCWLMEAPTFSLVALAEALFLL